MTDYLDTAAGRRIAYNLSPGTGPVIVFLGGFRSDKEGTKALFLEHWAKDAGRGFLRFDYSGHGMSSGDFLDGCIGDWAADAEAVINAVTDGPVVLVGSSMGGWISLLLTKRLGVAGLVTIAAAPDFTEDSMWAGFSTEQRATLKQDGQVALPSDYSDEPYIITRRLIEEGRKTLVLRDPLPLPMPTRFLHGTADADVTEATALRLMAHVTGADIRLTLVKNADHRFSEPENLAQIQAAVEDVLT